MSLTKSRPYPQPWAPPGNATKHLYMCLEPHSSLQPYRVGCPRLLIPSTQREQTRGHWSLAPIRHRGHSSGKVGTSQALPPALHAGAHQHFFVTGSLISNVARDITALLNLPATKPSAHCQDDSVPSGPLWPAAALGSPGAPKDPQKPLSSIPHILPTHTSPAAAPSPPST